MVNTYSISSKNANYYLKKAWTDKYLFENDRKPIKISTNQEQQILSQISPICWNTNNQPL